MVMVAGVMVMMGRLRIIRPLLYQRLVGTFLIAAVSYPRGDRGFVKGRRGKDSRCRNGTARTIERFARVLE